MSQYKHGWISGDKQVRLLRIIPNKDPQAKLAVELEAFDLDKLPPYSALSYTWGKAIQEENEAEVGHGAAKPSAYIINIRNEDLEVNENLHDVLIQFRGENLGFLWADSICIDQMNAAERAAQVQLMGDIYSLAERVIVWLGKDKIYLESLLWTQNTWYPLIISLQGHESQNQTEEYDLRRLLNLSVDEWARRWHEHRQFYSRRRWFSQTWIAQEFILARDVAMYCGDTELDWELMAEVVQLGKFAGGMTYLQQNHYYSLKTMRNNFYLGPDAMREEYTALIGVKSEAELWYGALAMLTHLFRSQKSTLAHDKLFGILGYAKKWVSPPLGLEIEVDYEKCVEVVFREWATATIAALPDLFLLSLVEDMSARRLDKLPRWCPDLTAATQASSMLFLRGPDWSGYKPFNAVSTLSGDKTELCFVESLMQVSGKTVGTVKHVGDRIPGAITYKSYAKDGRLDFDAMENDMVSCTKALLELLLGLDRIYPLTGQHRLEVMWRTFVFDHWPNGMTEGWPEFYHPAPTDINSYIGSYILYICATASQNEADFQALVPLLQQLGPTPPDMSLPSIEQIRDFKTRMGNSLDREAIAMAEGYTEIAMSAAKYCHNRKLFYTERGWLGLGPPSLQPSDEVWLLKAGRVPFALRPTPSGQYLLVGEVYIHGIMDGELVDAPGGLDGFSVIELV